VPITQAMSRWVSHSPHDRSGGTNREIGRNVYVLIDAAPRDLSDPLAGTTPSVIQRSQSQMVTLVNGSFRGAFWSREESPASADQPPLLIALAAKSAAWSVIPLNR
jgi:hypothetical protein